jgi:hypothetical protein
MTDGETPLVARVSAAAIGASAVLAGPEAAIAGAALTPVLEDLLGKILGRLSSRRRARVEETLIDAADDLGGDKAEQLQRIVDAAASDETYEELLARALTAAQDTAMRDKRRALGRALASAVDETGTAVDGEIAFVRLLADLDPVHVRVLRIMSHRPPHLDQVARQANAANDPTWGRQWYGWSLQAADPGLGDSVWGALRVLEQHGLIWDRGEQLVPHPHGMQHEYMISPYGDYLLARLATPEDRQPSPSP